MLTAHLVKSSVSQIIIDCFRSCIQYFYLPALLASFEIYQFVSMIWFAELSVCHDSSWKDLSLVLFDYSPCFQIAFLQLAKEFMLLTFFLSLNVCSRFSLWIPASVFIPGSYSGAILIVLFCIWICQTDPEHTIMFIQSCGSQEDLSFALTYNRN